MESKPTYETKQRQERESWRCGCGEILGYIERKSTGAVCLLRRGDRIYYAEIYCQECGAARMWMPNQAAYEALVAAIERRNIKV